MTNNQPHAIISLSNEREEIIMRKFGLVIHEWKVPQLIDLETGEILTDTVQKVQHYLRAFEGKYTLQLI